MKIKEASDMVQSSPHRSAASPVVALILFLVSFGLHRGLDWIGEQLTITDVEFKLWAIGTIFAAILLPLWACVRILRLEAKDALNALTPKWKRVGFAVPVDLRLPLALTCFYR